jgi:hypothetical protein
MKLGFVTFAGGDIFWKLAIKRIRNQAQISGEFSAIGVYETKDLARIADSKDFEFIKNNSPGYGYWLWKPIIVLDFLQINPEIDVVLYADAGCDLNFNTYSIDNWNRYLDILKTHECVAFAMELIEKSWTKEELFRAFPEYRQYQNTEQLLGGVFLMRRNFAIQFCNQWLDHMRTSNFELLGDSYDLKIQDSQFLRHRHDQSFFSLMAKNDARVIILNSREEVYFEPDWGTGRRYPIWTSRNKSYVPKYKTGIFNQFERIIERILKRLFV